MHANKPQQAKLLDKLSVLQDCKLNYCCEKLNHILEIPWLQQFHNVRKHIYTIWGWTPSHYTPKSNVGQEQTRVSYKLCRQTSVEACSMLPAARYFLFKSYYAIDVHEYSGMKTTYAKQKQMPKPQYLAETIIFNLKWWCKSDFNHSGNTSACHVQALLLRVYQDNRSQNQMLKRVCSTTKKWWHKTKLTVTSPICRRNEQQNNIICCYCVFSYKASFFPTRNICHTQREHG